VKGPVNHEGETPARLTRAQAQARTRAALLEAAASLFAERGFHGTSVEEVVARAGFTRGAFYSNFSDKADLFLAVLDHRTNADRAALTPLISTAPSLDALVGRLAARPPDDEGRDADRQWQLLLTEFRLHALREPDVRPRLAAWEQAQRSAYRAAVEHLFAASGLEPPGDPGLIALIIQTLVDGVAVHQMIEGDALGPHPFLDTLDLLIRASTALAASLDQER